MAILSRTNFAHSTDFVTTLFREAVAALLRKPTRTDWQIRIVTFFVPVIFLAAVVLQPWLDSKWMFLDTLTAAKLADNCCGNYFGLVSTLGIMLWVATAAICLFCAFIMRAGRRNGVATRFALSAGLLTGWLALDDAFLLHENVLPSIGINQNIVLLTYACLAVAYVLSSWRAVLASDFWLLLMGGGALASSILIDAVFHTVHPVMVALEDGAKFFGIFCWASFHVTSLYRMIGRAVESGVSAVR